MRYYLIILIVLSGVLNYKFWSADLLVLMPNTPVLVTDKRALVLFQQGIKELMERRSGNFKVENRISVDTYNLDKENQYFEPYTNYEYAILLTFTSCPGVEGYSMLSVSAVPLLQGIGSVTESFTIYTYNYRSVAEIDQVNLWRTAIMRHLEDLALSTRKKDIAVDIQTACRDEGIARKKILNMLKNDKDLIGKCYFHSGKRSTSYIACGSTGCDTEAQKVNVFFYKQDTPEIPFGTIKKNTWAAEESWLRIVAEAKKNFK